MLKKQKKKVSSDTVLRNELTVGGKHQTEENTLHSVTQEDTWGEFSRRKF